MMARAYPGIWSNTVRILIVANHAAKLTQQYPELARIASGNQPLILDGLVTSQALETILDGNQFEVVHIIGEGAINLLDLADGPVTTEWLARRLRKQSQLRLVFINACDSVSTGAALHRVLQVAVIANPLPVNDKAAHDFALSLYGSLARGATVNQAYDESCDSLTVLHPLAPTPLLLNGRAMEDSQFQTEVLAKLSEVSCNQSAHQIQLDTQKADLNQIRETIHSIMFNRMALYLIGIIVIVFQAIDFFKHWVIH